MTISSSPLHICPQCGNKHGTRKPKVAFTNSYGTCHICKKGKPLLDSYVFGTIGILEEQKENK